MKATDDGDGAFRYSVTGGHNNKGGKRYPWRFVFLFLGPEPTTQQSVWHSGLGFPFLKKKKKRKKRMTKGKKIGEEKKGEREKSLRVGNRANA